MVDAIPGSKVVGLLVVVKELLLCTEKVGEQCGKKKLSSFD